MSRTQNLCPQQMLRERANGETFVSAAMCPQQCVLVCQAVYIASLKRIPSPITIIVFSKQCLVENIQGKFQKKLLVTLISEESP